MTDTIDREQTEIADNSDATDDMGIEAMAAGLFERALASIELMTVYLGLRLGLYTALRSACATSDELASRAGIDPRYAKEWLEQQTVAGIVACDDREAPEDARQFRLPAGHATVLLDADHPACTGPLALALGGVARVLPDLVAAYRSGGGVAYARYGTDFRDGQAGFNRPAFVHLLAESWLAIGVPEVHARLSAAEGARVADVACGAGWSSIALARAYPGIVVDGFDIDDASIGDARRNAADAALTERVRFEVRDASRLGDETQSGGYDLVTIFEALHDLSNPIDALRECRRLCSDTGSVIVMDERTAQSFAESDGPIERFLYGASVLHCLPVGMADQPSSATGAVMRVDTVRRYVAAAGFSAMDVLPIENDLYRFYRLHR